VHNPGLIRSQESISVLRAIFQSGGFKDTGNIESVVILRYNGTPTPEFRIVDLKTALKHGSEQQDIWLQSYDVVYVPKTYIASANQFVSEYIDKMIPIQRSIGVFWNFFPGGGNTVFGR
jgi:protein involved in polysaccharide export with SLBB domain